MLRALGVIFLIIVMLHVFALLLGLALLLFLGLASGGAVVVMVLGAVVAGRMIYNSYRKRNGYRYH